MIPHTLYVIGIWWPPLPYMEQVSYGPPHLKCLHVLYDLWSPHTLYGIGIVWSPACTCGSHMCMVPPHVQYDVNDLWSPYLIWNKYLMVLPYLTWTGIVWSPTTCTFGPSHVYHLMVPLTLYGTGIIWPPTCTIWFFQDSFDRGPLHVLIMMSWDSPQNM